MKRFPDEVIAEIRRKSDIVDTISSYLTLTKRGKNYWGVCPFHDDHAPSMSVSPERQIYKCFVCGAGGNVFTFIQRIEGIKFSDAVVKQAASVNMDVREYVLPDKHPVDEKKRRLYELMTTVQSFTQYTLYTDDGQQVLKSLYDRGYNDALIKTFGIGVALDGHKIHAFLKGKGFSDDDMLACDIIRISDSISDVFMNRIMFPIADQNGRVVAFSARTIDPRGKVKYINTAETTLYVKGNHLYNLHNAKEAARKHAQIFICEGVTDVMAFHASGYQNAVALLGVACTDAQIQLLRQVSKTVILAFDGDKAGYEATFSIGSKLVKERFSVKVWYNDTGKDPDEVLKTHGKEKVVEGVEHALGWYDFLFTYTIGLYGLSSFEDKKRVALTMANHLSEADALTRNYYLKEIAQKTGFDDAVIQQLLKDQKPVVKQQPIIDAQVKPLDVFKSERELLKQMILSKQAAYEFRDKLGFLPHHDAHELALVILDLYRTQDNIEVADLYSQDLTPSLATFMTNLVEDTGVSVYKPEIVLEAIEHIQSIMTRKKIKEIRQRINDKTFHEQMELLTQVTKSKRKL